MSEQYRVTVVFEGRDQLSAVVRQVSDNMADVSKAGSKFGSVLSDIGKTAAGVVGGLVGFSILAEIRQFAVEATRAFVEFERESVKLAALSREAGQSVGLLAQAFRTVASAAAREFAVSGQEAMQALEALVKAGLSGRDAIAAVGEVIKLAKIEGVDFASASAAVVQVMAQFGLAGHEAARAVDVLVNASRAGIGTAADFANGLANAGATAKAMGMSIEDAATWLVILERRFGNAQEAGTHLNRFLLELTDIAKKLGVSVTDAAGNMRNMNDVILDVIAAVKNSGLSFAELQERLKGVDMRALKALFTFAQMTENVEELREAIGQAGTATETFGAIMETSAGKFQKMQAQVDLMQRRIGEGFSMIATTLGSVFLPIVDFAVGAWTDIISTATGNIVGQLQGQLQAWLAMGKVTEEVAADIIAANIEMGRITVEEGLKIAESLGVTSEKLLELAGVSGEAAEGMEEVGESAEEAAQKIREANSIVETLARQFGVSKDRVVELVNTMFGLNVTYDEHADLVEKLKNAFGLTEEQARQLIQALQEESEKQKQAAEAAREHEEALRKATDALNKGIEALLNFGKVQGPLTGTINSIREALNTLGDNISTNLRGKVEEALRYFEDLNEKFISLETRSRELRAAIDVAGIGISYYNTLTSIGKALIVDETQAIEQKIARLREEIEIAKERERLGLISKDTAKEQIEGLRAQIAELERQKEQLQASVALTDEQVASQTRLKAVQDVLGFTTQQLSLMQTGLQLAMMGAGETGESFMNTIIALTEAQMDGIVTEEEMKTVLQGLGVTFDETGKPVLNLKGFLEKFKQEVIENRDKVNEFRDTLLRLHGTTIHTYHYHHIITVREEGGGGPLPSAVDIMTDEQLAEYQRGTWYVPRTGPAILHEGEMVIPADLAEEIRRGRGRGVVVNITVNGAGMDADQLAEVISRRMVSRLRAL